MNNSTSVNTLELTFSQAKAVITALGRDVLETFISDLNNQPEFMQELGEFDDVASMISLYQSGCAANAHRSVFYFEAQQCMIKCSDSIEDQLEGSEIVITFNPSEESFSQFCSKCCVEAVTSYLYHFEEVLEVLETTNY